MGPFNIKSVYNMSICNNLYSLHFELWHWKKSMKPYRLLFEQIMGINLFKFYISFFQDEIW